jgi:hypothetical protein
LDRRYRLIAGNTELRSALGFLSCDPAIEGPPAVEVAIHVEPQATGFVALHEGRMLLQAPSPRAMMEALHAHLLQAAFDERPTEALLHAASLVHRGRRILLVGTKAAGKTTLTLRLAQAGYAVEGDENVFLGRSGVVARPRACRVKESALGLLPEIARIIAAAPSYGNAGTRLFNLDPGLVGPPWRIAPGPVDCVIALRPNHGGASSIAPLAHNALFGLVMAESAWRAADRTASVAGLAALASRAAIFELTLGDPASAVSCVESAVAA